MHIMYYGIPYYLQGVHKNSLKFFFSMALAAQSLAAVSPFLRFFEITHKETPQSVGFLWTSDQPDAETST